MCAVSSCDRRSSHLVVVSKIPESHHPCLPGLRVPMVNLWLWGKVSPRGAITLRCCWGKVSPRGAITLRCQGSNLRPLPPEPQIGSMIQRMFSWARLLKRRHSDNIRISCRLQTGSGKTAHFLPSRHRLSPPRPPSKRRCQPGSGKI